MRLFVAIDVPDVIKDHLAFLQRSLDEVGHLRLSHPKSIHLTLNFLGDYNDPDEIIRLLSSVQFSSFFLKLSEIGYFPSKEDPRIVWVGLGESLELSKLQSSIDKIFTPKKSFKPHLTIARLKPKAKISRVLQASNRLLVKNTCLYCNSSDLR